MQVLALVQAQVQVALGTARERFEKDGRELDIPRAELRLRQRHLPDEERAPREIDRCGDQSLVHRQGRPAVANEADLVADGLEDRFTEYDSEVLGRVVAVDFDVPHGAHPEIDEAVARDLLDHVRQKGERASPVSLAEPSDQLDADVGFARLSSDFCRAGHGRAIPRKGFRSLADGATLSLMRGGPSDRQRPSDSRHRAATPDATEDFLFHLYRGSELLQDNRVHEAKEELEQALKLQPRDAKGQDLLAVVYFRLGLYPRAIEIYEELMRDFPNDASLAQNLSLSYLKTGQPDKARTLLERLVAPAQIRLGVTRARARTAGRLRKGTRRVRTRATTRHGAPHGGSPRVRRGATIPLGRPVRIGATACAREGAAGSFPRARTRDHARRNSRGRPSNQHGASAAATSRSGVRR